MSLKDKKSLFDRNQIGVQGNPVGQNPPSEGNFFTDEGVTGSPFDSRDHLVDLLTKNVKSDNSGQTYQPSPNKSDFQDLDGVTGGQGYFHGVANPGRFQGKLVDKEELHKHLLTKSYTYQHGVSNPVTVGPSPGPSGNSDFQDLNGGIGQLGETFDIGFLSNRKGVYKDTGPTDGRY